MNAPLPWRYEGGGVLRSTSPFFAKRADQQYEAGKTYLLLEMHERSEASHRQYFASINDAWSSLPDGMAVDFPTPDILRRHALIMTGFRRERKFVASSKAEARKIAAFLRPQSVSDDYAIISVHENIVIEWKAKSQSYKEMGKVDFQKSKQAVLDFVAELIGVTPETLSANAGQAA